MTQEIAKEVDYFTKMDLITITRLDRPTAILAYKVLKLAQKPIFSGSLDHRINMLDYNKVTALLDIGFDTVKQQIGLGSDLVEELKHKMEELGQKKIFHCYWDILNESKGCLPEARKGATMNMINNQLYVFGGFSRDTFNDLKVFDLTVCKWQDV